MRGATIAIEAVMLCATEGDALDLGMSLTLLDSSLISVKQHSLKTAPDFFWQYNQTLLL